MSGGKTAAVIIVILVVTWLLLLTLGRLGLMPGSTQKYVKDRKWDKMREYLKKLYKADGTEDTTICKEIRDWWVDNQESYDKFIKSQEDGDPETLYNWAWGIPMKVEYADFVDEYFKDVGKEKAETTFLDIAEGISACQDEVDLTTLKGHVVRIIETPVPDGYDPLAGDCSNVTSEQSVLPNYVWSYDEDTFIDISGMQNTEMGEGWQEKVKMVCTPLTMDEEYVPSFTDEAGKTIPAKIKFTNVVNPISDKVIEVFDKITDKTTGLVHTLTSEDTSFDIEVGETALTSPLYYIKLEGNKTDHIFTGDVGTIAFLVETEATDAVPAKLNYKKIQFTPNVDIPIGYEIIVEANALPLSADHSCPTGSKLVAQLPSTSDGQITKTGGAVDLPQELCYSTPPGQGSQGPGIIDFIPTEYSAYIRKTAVVTSTGQSATPEVPIQNPKYKFATLVRAASTTTTTGST